MDKIEKRNRIIVIALLAAVFVALVIEACWVGNVIAIFIIDAEAEDMEGTECWAFCKPDGIVNIRSQPRKNSAEVAWVTCGMKMMTNGKTRNGYIYIFDMAAETTAGWISERYIVYEEPKAVETEMVIRAEGRVACRKWMGGKVGKWYRDGDRVIVHWLADGWAVTDRGYIRYEYLEEE